MYIYTDKPSKVLSALTKLLMTDEVTRIDGICYTDTILLVFTIQFCLKRFLVVYRTTRIEHPNKFKQIFENISADFGSVRLKKS